MSLCAPRWLYRRLEIADMIRRAGGDASRSHKNYVTVSAAFCRIPALRPGGTLHINAAYGSIADGRIVLWRNRNQDDPGGSAARHRRHRDLRSMRHCRAGLLTSGRPKWRRRGLCAAACAQWKSNWRDSGVCRRTWRTNSPPWRRGRLRHAVRAGTPAGRPVRHDAGCHDAHAPTRSGNFAQSSSNCPPKQRTRYASRATTRFS